jgi:hypothetical protein
MAIEPRPTHSSFEEHLIPWASGRHAGPRRKREISAGEVGT